MRKILIVLVALAIACPAASALAGTPGRFIQYPDISGTTIVFNWEHDLWTVPATGGMATRLTTHPGGENVPKFSPDGKQIVFSGQYEGPNLYLIPVTGGAPSRVTYMGAGLQAVGWTPDGSRIVFRSGHENTFRPIMKLYTVSPGGSLPEPMPMDRGILCSYSPDGTKLAYNRRGNEEYYWKRYKGGQYTDIWLLRLRVEGLFAPLTDYVGKNAYPMWIGNLMYFVSDRGQERHRQPLHLRLRDEAGEAGHGLRRLRRADAGDRRAVDRVRAGRLAARARHRHEPGPARERRDAERPVGAGGADHQPARLHPRDDRVERRQDGGVRGARRHLPGRDRRQPAAAQPDAHAGQPRAVPADLARRHAGGVLLGQERRLPDLRDGRGRRQGVGAAHHGARSLRLPPRVVAGRLEAPVRQQGLLAVLPGRRHEEADEVRLVEPDEERRVLLGGQRLLVVARRQVGRLLVRRVQPEQQGVPLQPRPGEELPGDRRVLRQHEPDVRRRTASTSTSCRTATSPRGWTSSRTTTSSSTRSR